MKKEILKNKSDAELGTLLKEKKNALRSFRFKIAKGKARNVKEGSLLRSEIARLLTEFTHRKHG